LLGQRRFRKNEGRQGDRWAAFSLDQQILMSVNEMNRRRT